MNAREGSPGAAVALLTATAAAMIAVHVGGRAVRDALFLDVLDAAQLPNVMLASAVLSALGVALWSRLAAMGPARLVPATLLLSGAGYAAEFVLLSREPAIAVWLLYLHVVVLGSLLMSGFWSLVTERFDPHTAKRVIGRVTAGATVGGVVGGLMAERVSAWLGVRSTLLVLGAISVVAAGAAWRAGKGMPTGQGSESERVVDALGDLRATPYLKLLGALVLLTALAAGVLDFAFKAEAEAVHHSREDLVRFFAIFYTATSLVTLLAQTMLSRAVLEKLGIGGTIALLPGAIVLSGTLGAGVTRLWTVALARASEAVLSSSLYRSGYELLFTPLAAHKRRAVKTTIDVGFDRVGGAVASVLVMLLVALAPRQVTAVCLATAALVSTVAMVVALRLHRGYVAELAASLRAGRVKLHDSDIVDRTTRRTLSDTTMAIDRSHLLAQIDDLRRQHDDPPGLQRVEATDARALPLNAIVRAAVPKEPAANTLGGMVSDLTCGDHERVRRVLLSPLDARVVAVVIPLLGHPTHGRAARRALSACASTVSGQLVDAILDPSQPEAVRRRLPDVLKSAGDSRAAQGLFAGLDAELPSVRQRCAAALHSLVREHPELTPRHDDVLLAAMRAVERPKSALREVFAVLALTLEEEPLGLALSALTSRDPTLRGTSFEYLDNVLPDELRKRLWPRLVELAKSAPPARDPDKPPRSRRELVDDLTRSADALVIDRNALIRNVD